MKDVAGPTRSRVLATMVGGRPAFFTDLCVLLVEACDVSGAGISLFSDGRPQGVAMASSRHYEAVEDLQFTLGEGPAADAYRTGEPVLEADLGRREGRWLWFARAAVRAGVDAVFAFPLRAGSVTLGAATLYRDSPGPLAARTIAEASTLVDVSADLLLRFVARSASSDALGESGALHEGESALVGARWVAARRAEVHQAAGMVAAQLDVGILEAEARLRGRAWAESRPLTEVAADVLSRRLRF